MSFDIFLVRFEAGERANVPLEPLRALMHSIPHEREHSGKYRVIFPDGSDQDFNCIDLEGSNSVEGVTFWIYGPLSTYLVKFIFDFAKAGDMIILATLKDFSPILTAVHQKNELPSDLQEPLHVPILCQTSDELELLLTKGFTEWKRYRDYALQIINRPGRFN